MKIGDREIGNGQPTYIIAEAGTNHMGDVRKAMSLILAASEAGADAIKFQAFKNKPFEPLFCPYEGDEQRIEYWDQTCLTDDQWAVVAHYAKTVCEMHFILSVFQPSAMKLLEYCDAAKVASRAAKTFPYDQTDLPLIISTGMISADEEGVIWAGNEGRDEIYLRCIAEYPTPLEAAMDTDWSPDWLGLSDHSGTPWPGLQAIANKKAMLEVHFSPNAIGRDAPVEITPHELKIICDFRDAMAA